LVAVRPLPEKKGSASIKSRGEEESLAAQDAPQKKKGGLQYGRGVEHGEKIAEKFLVKIKGKGTGVLY